MPVLHLVAAPLAWLGREAQIIEDIRLGLEEARAGKVVPHERAMKDVQAAVDRAVARRKRSSGRK